MNEINLMKEAILIRRVEETFLELFSQGKLNGTVHTCVGQEFSAVAFAGQLKDKDFIFSNHRCHGHYISFTKDYQGLIAELMGKEIGVCGGVGSSQHLCKKNFFSNGIQGGIVPVAAGLALANKLKQKNSIVVVFIGDGTLGQGVVYETMNIISKWEVPLLIVLENNKYSQSTPQSTSLSGDILSRAKAFNLATRKSSTWDIEEIVKSAKESIESVRKNKKPIFHLVDTYRLNPHSKGDDNRDIYEIESFKKKDPINIFSGKNPDEFNNIVANANNFIDSYIKKIENENELSIEKYYYTNSEPLNIKWTPLNEINTRQADLINSFFDKKLNESQNTVLLGEDICAPYGGAFKVTKNLSIKYPDKVFSTPISEQAITGIANGLALGGIKPYLEIMFGDFITLSLDQIVNHASKFYHMYNKQITCPIVIRTPMGGGRGYGPTHSQTLDKFLVGIDNITTVSLNNLLTPIDIYEAVHGESHPLIVIENKLDYNKKVFCKRLENYFYEKSNHKYPVIRVKPLNYKATATIVTYGGSVEIVIDSVDDIFYKLDIVPEILIITKIHPIDIDVIVESVRETKKLFTVEEGSSFAGIGSEIIASVKETLNFDFVAKRIASLPVPIASSKSLEAEILVNKRKILNAFESVI